MDMGMYIQIIIYKRYFRSRDLHILIPIKFCCERTRLLTQVLCFVLQATVCLTEPGIKRASKPFYTAFSTILK